MAAHAKLSEEQLQRLPPPTSHPVDFAKEIRPLLESACVKCHGRGKAKGGFSLEDRAALLRGGNAGPAVIPGKSAESYFIELVSGLDPDNVMPQKGSKLKPEQVGLLRAWIDQGANWDAGVTFAKKAPLNLEPRRPDLPTSPDAPSHPIDRIVRAYLAAQGVAQPRLVDDRTFARRVFLDAVGLLPSPEEMAEFLQDSQPDRRHRLVRRVLAGRQRYAENWLTFWNDALRNDYTGTGYIDNGRKQITGWLFSALYENRPFDQFVRELIHPAPGAEGFVRGIVWRGVVNASQTPEMQAAQNLSQLFLGVNLKCASCHDSFINDWALTDAYGLASVFAEKPLEMVHCDKPTGKIAEMRFPYAGLGQIEAKATRDARLQQLAEIMTGPKNGRLGRTMVNRLWARFLGRGLVEPVDDMENPAWSQDLLDWLATDFAEHGYDLKHVMEQILTSEAYQLPAVPTAEKPEARYVFRGPALRRLNAEQYRDALCSISGSWDAAPSGSADFAGSSQAAATRGSDNLPAWIWDSSGAATNADSGTVYFRRQLELPRAPRQAAVVVACDNRFRLFVNGSEVGSGAETRRTFTFDLTPHLQAGENVLAVEAANDAPKSDAANPPAANPAGLLVAFRAVEPEAGTEKAWIVVSDASWVCSRSATEGWAKRGATLADAKPACRLGDADAPPWRLGQALQVALAKASFYGQTRASLLNNDPLMSAMGRPNREQVTTGRLALATTLQALEVTNGETFSALLKRAAAGLLRGGNPGSSDMVSMVYQRALGRLPTATEQAAAEEVVGSPVKAEGVEDLLWAVAMLPEFQLIH